MSYQADTTVFAKPTGALDPSQVVAGIAAYLAPDPAQPEHYINVRLSNGSGYYTAGGTSVSGGGVLTADQGSPALLSSAWPIKVTDGSNVLGTPTGPFTVILSTGSLGNQGIPGWVTGTVAVQSLPGPLIDATNSSTTPLSASANFVGSGIDVSGFSTLTVSYFADANGTMYTQFSSDGTHWDYSGSWAVLSGVAAHVQTGPQGRYFRVFYANGNQAQTIFRLQTIHRVVTAHHPVVSVSNLIGPDSDAIMTKSVITGKSTGGGGSGYVDVKVSPAGAVQVGGSVNVISGSVTDLSVGGVALSEQNPLRTLMGGSNATVSALTASVSSQLLLTANLLRRGVVLVNDSVANCFLKFGAVSSLALYTYKLSPGQTLELPTWTYTGRMDAIWDVATGSLMITEVTA